MSNKTLTVLVSTYNERVKSLDNLLARYNRNVKYIVVHQVDNSEDYREWSDKLIARRKDLRYSLLLSSGVTKSRNIALSQVDGDYALFMDDDVKLADDFHITILEFFAKHSDASVLTFQAGNMESGEALKDYPTKVQRHTKISILKVGTIEVAFDVKAVQATGVCFPEHLGAGSCLPACDEPVFLARLMAKGLKLMFIPETIVFHPELSSGKVFVSENTLLCRGVAFREIFGRFISIPVIILFYLKNRGKFQLSNQSAFLALCKGYLMTKFD